MLNQRTNKKLNLTPNKQRGQVLLVTVLVLFSTFALATTLGGLVLYELRSSISIGESTKALYAAESGIEWKLFETNKWDISAPEMTNDTKYSTSVETGYIRATGTSNNTNRGLEVTLD